jgi:hypothetical protein
VLSRLPRRPQPVPPIYAPEVAAEGVVFAADHPDRKEHWVGASTVAAIVAQKLAAPLLDQYLARTGYDSQQTDEREPADRPSNLWQPLDQPPDSDQGAHGRFDDKSKPRSAQLTVTERVEEAGATVRRAFDSLIGAGRDNFLGGGRPRQTKPAPKSAREPWSEATSQQTDQEALVAGHDSTPSAQNTASDESTRPAAETAPPSAEATLSETPTPSETRMSETGADIHQPQETGLPDPFEGAPPLSGMDVPPVHTAPPVSTENTPWYRGPETPPRAETDDSASAEETMSPDEGTPAADQENHPRP